MTESLQTQIKKNKNLLYLVREVRGYFTMVGCAENYFSPFAIAMKATELQVGLLNSIPQLISGIAQLAGLKLIDGSINRKNIIVYGSAIQAFTLLLIGLIPFFIESSSARNISIIILASIYLGSMNAHVPAWTSLYRDLVPEDIRARFTGYRSQGSQMLMFISFILAALLLETLANLGHLYWGFFIIMSVGAFARLYSTLWLSKLEYPVYDREINHQFSLWQFIRRLPKTRFGRYVIFFSMMNMAIVTVSSFVAYYILEVLGYSYVDYMLVNSILLLGQFGSAQRWGHLIEKFGALKILKATSIILCTIPFLYMTSTSLLWLAVLYVIIGVNTSGYQLACFDYVFRVVTPKKLARCTAFQSFFSTNFHLFGSLFGAAILAVAQSKYLNNLNSSQAFFIAFSISGIMRITICATFLRLAEPKNRNPTAIFTINQRASQLTSYRESR